MAGRGPAPKDPATRARRNNPAAGMRVVQVERATQPKLPSLYSYETGEDGKRRRIRFVWPAVTKRWWAMWAESPLSVDYTDLDWSYLLDTALLHAEFWKGDRKLEAALRQRMQKFGATPEDRARLRIMFVAADEAEARTSPAPAGLSARDRRGPLKAV